MAALIAQRRADAARSQAAGPDSGGGTAAPSLAEPSVAETGPVRTGRLADPVVQRLAESGGGRKLAALKTEVRGRQKILSAHQPPTAAAGAAQKAAKPPQDDKQAQGKAVNAEKMNAAKPGEFDKAAFIRAVNEAIAAQAPKNLDEADTFSKSGKADAVKGQVQGRVVDGEKQSAGQIESTTAAPPDTAAAKEKPVTPLRPGQPAATPAAPDAANAVPDKAAASATDFSAGPAQVDQQMAQAQVTENQLAKSNEPEFTDALKEKKTGEQHAQTAPAQVRGKEAQTLAAAKANAARQGTAAMQQMAAANKTATAAVTSGQHGAQGSDEAKRAQVTSILQKVFDAAQKDVEQILSGLDKKVDDAFTTGEKKVRDAFTADHKRRMDAYKDKRYSGLKGKARWVKDKFAGLPEAAGQIFVTARQGYVAGMQQVISNVADIIGGELTRAKQRITAGRNQLRAEIAKLPKDLQAIGKQAAGEFAGKFDELTSSVDAKSTELVDTLASKYTEALKSVDAEIEAEKQKSEGLIAKATDAVGGVIKTIMQLKDLLLGVLAKAAQAVMAILKDPIGFLGHLVSAVGAGLRNFMNNVGTHLRKGLIGWLLGTMNGAGLQIPTKFDLHGILGMIASLLGLTWAAIRGRIVTKGIPEQAMSTVEAGVPQVGKLQNEGVAGVTDEIKEQVGDLKPNLLGKISQYLIPTVLIAGITWIISLLNPASAFIKACKMIIDIVTFIIDRGAQIVEFVNAVLDAIIAIATGGVGGIPALIEKALAKSVPVLIGALAAILGIGDIADKIKKFFQALSKPVMKAVDWIVGKIVKLGKKIWAKLKNKFGKDKTGAARNPAAEPGQEKAAISDAEKALSAADSHEAAQQKVHKVQQECHVPLHLVVESRSQEGEVVHVQTAQTSSHRIPDKGEQMYHDLREKLIKADARTEAVIALDALCEQKRAQGRGLGGFLNPLIGLARRDMPKCEEALAKEYWKYVEPVENELPIDRLKRKIEQVKMSIDHAIGVEEDRRLPECQALLGSMRKWTNELAAYLYRIARGDVNRGNQENDIRKQVNNILEQFVKDAEGHGYPSVKLLKHPSDYVLAGEIRQKYSEKIRDLFYGTDYSDKAETERDNHTAEFIEDNSPKRHPELSGQPGFNDKEYFRCPKCGELRKVRIRNTKGKLVKNVTIDHVFPVAAHWNREGDGGNNTNQDIRKAFYSDLTNIDFMCGPCNSSKGSGGEEYSPRVGPSFRGPNE